MNNPDYEAMEKLVAEYGLFRILCYLSELCRERGERVPRPQDVRQSRPKAWWLCVSALTSTGC